MSGSTTYYPGPLPVARSSDQLLVFRFFDKADSFDLKYEYLSWIKCLGITITEGAEPGVARFRYSFGDVYGEPGDPQRFEEVFPLDAVGPRIINGDDRLVVRRVTEEGISEYLFDGFVQAPEASLGPETEAVSFIALGAPVREWDTPLLGALMRDADFPGADVNRQTDLPARFNPDGRPNASPDGADSGTDPAKYPVFLGPFAPKNLINGDVVRPWTLAMAARYLIVRGTMQLKDDGSDDKPSQYVTFDDLTYLDDLLTSWTPSASTAEADAYAALQAALIDPASTPEEIAAAEDAYAALWDEGDAGVIDSEDNSTFVIQDIEAPDLDVTGMPWPVALQRLIEPYGFAIRFDLTEAQPAEGDPALTEGQFGDPQWKLKIYWKESDAPGKTLLLQQAGGTLDPGQTNIGELSLTRDSSGVANRIAIDAAPVRIEAPLVMAPGFHVDAADATDPGQFARVKFEEDEAGDVPDKYRLYIFDECGEGHFDFKSFSWFDNTTEGIAGDLTPAFESIAPARLKDAVGAAARFWSIRRRPTLTTMNSVGADGKPMQATLYCSNDYQGDMPGVWDGTGTWQALVTGEWRALDDRLGFYLTANDVNDWAIGVDDAGATVMQLGEGRIRNVTWTAKPVVDLAHPELSQKYPRYMLLCTFDADNDFDVVAGKRAASTTSFTVTRRVDARDRFRKLVVNKWSFFLDFSLSNYGQTDLVLTDDTEAARSLADAERRHSETCTFAGTATIPRLTTAYNLGDHILGIDGRNVSFRSNLGAEQLESPVYPSVVSITWSFDGGQSTQLSLSDQRAAPVPPRERRPEA